MTELPEVLPRGRHAAPRAVVVESQRGRLLTAMAECLAEEGWAGTAVADVIKRAGVSRKTFYEHFANKEDCFLQAYDLGVELLLGAIEDAVEAAPDPVAAARASVEAYLRTLASEPAFARAYFVEALAAGPAALQRRSAVLARFADQLRAIRARSGAVLPELPEVPDHRFGAATGAVNELVAEHVRTHGTDGVEELADAILDVVLALLVGDELARQLLRG